MQFSYELLYVSIEVETISSPSALPVKGLPLPSPLACDVLPFGIVVEPSL